jgi:hypothetical protein
LAGDGRHDRADLLVCIDQQGLPPATAEALVSARSAIETRHVDDAVLKQIVGVFDALLKSDGDIPSELIEALEIGLRLQLYLAEDERRGVWRNLKDLDRLIADMDDEERRFALADIAEAIQPVVDRLGKESPVPCSPQIAPSAAPASSARSKHAA